MSRKIHRAPSGFAYCAVSILLLTLSGCARDNEAVRLGLTAVEVKRILGEPQKTVAGDDAHSFTWIYNDLDTGPFVEFKDDKVVWVLYFKERWKNLPPPGTIVKDHRTRGRQGSASPK